MDRAEYVHDKACIRILTPADIPHLAILEKSCFDDPWSETALKESIVTPAGTGFALTINNEIIGYLLAYHIVDEGHLLNIAIRPDFRGQGLGRHLLEYWLQIGIREKWVVAYLEVRAGNIPAIELYRSCGFTEMGLRKKYYADGEDALVMVKQFQTKSAIRGEDS